MNVLQVLQLMLFLGQGILDSVDSGKLELPKEVLEDVQAGVALLQKYAGTDVTFPQLESLRLTPQW